MDYKRVQYVESACKAIVLFANNSAAFNNLFEAVKFLFRIRLVVIKLL
jgi:hypothetical protein